MRIKEELKNKEKFEVWFASEENKPHELEGDREYAFRVWFTALASQPPVKQMGEDEAVEIVARLIATQDTLSDGDLARSIVRTLSHTAPKETPHAR